MAVTISAAAAAADGDSESEALLIAEADDIPKDSFHLAYIIYLTLGAGYLLPWNAFILAVDYFTHLYPGVPINRVFTVAEILLELVSLPSIVAFAHKSDAFVRINVGYALFLVALVAMPFIDVCYVKGRVGVYGGYYATVGLVGLTGLANGLVQGGVVGNAGELPGRYTQAVYVGTAASGVLVSTLRILTKALYAQDANGLRQGANLYFIVTITVMLLNIIFYNVVHRLPVIKYYYNLKKSAKNEEKEHKGDLTGKLWRSTLWDIVGAMKWYGSGMVMIYLTTLSIFPGPLTEDVHSGTLKDWYPVILIMGFNIFDLLGKSLTSLYLMKSARIAIIASFVRLLFLPLYYGCLHGPELIRTEIPVTILTCLLGLTNGYLTSVLMILAPKTVQIQYAEIAGTVLVLYLVIGLAIGSGVSWLWIL
ncbi:equilibrative nucleotide transporter 1-like [Andrographis paniculata]|uniref:equilibrative nucleotide transporter 1-like n=1 Tax=Andrographis paniculata TaxID=175694 RepID=UPI0021E944F3|nr:equilibrative nucleotide transporter 1-like [Andrographis paniculata]